MPLTPGTRLGIYHITALIGEGGMGQVFCARDTRLNRNVAIKLLPEAFALDADRLARFAREAQTLASLNHPHIAAIYGLEESGGVSALVMEFVEGEDLSQRIARGAIPVDEALPIARQIAEALEAAHEQGIVHRDLKPANIKVRADGTVKVLDFGLAKAIEPASSLSANAMNSPTLSMHATMPGVILGTAAYMAPEQARGKIVDKRADIWAFGVVLYEMLTGSTPFAGDTVTDIIAAVVTREPDWTAMPAQAPPSVRQLLRRCIEKDPKRRLRDVGEARLVLDGSLQSSGASMAASAVAVSAPAFVPEKRPRMWIATAVGFAVLTILLAGILQRTSRSAASADSFELAIAPPAGAEFQIGTNSGNVILSPDGTTIAFVAATPKATALWVRSLAVDDARALSGTEGAFYPFWSPDGRRIGFFAAGKLRTVEITGGLPETIADAPFGRGGAWSENGTIIFTPKGGAAIVRVAATGGTVAPLTMLDTARGEDAHYWPVFLPGGSRFLYFARSTIPENGGIYMGRLDGSAAPIRVVAALSSGVLVTRPSTGALYLAWVRDGDLLAQPFDADAGALRGTATTLARGVRIEESQRLPFASASRKGTIAWATARAGENVFALYDRSGRRQRVLDIDPGMINQPALSPDGQRLLFTRAEKGSADIFLHDLKAGTTRRVTTSPEYDESPTWTADGRAMIHAGREKGQVVLFQTTLDAGADPSEVFRAASPNSTVLETPHGRFVLDVGGSTAGIVAVPLFGSRTPVTLATGLANVYISSQSNDGRWLGITASIGGVPTGAIVRLVTRGPTPTFGGTFPLVADGGWGPHIRADGREVIVGTPDGLLKSIALTPAGDGLTLGVPTTLFKLPSGNGEFTVSGDGKQLVVLETPFAAGQTLRVLTNWEKRLTR